jgi:hypothetical protein
MALLAHELNRELEALAQNQENQTILFGKPEDPVSSILAAIRGSASIRRWASSLAMQCLTKELARTMAHPRGCGSDY